jgi:hypothetical protein
MDFVHPHAPPQTLQGSRLRIVTGLNRFWWGFRVGGAIGLASVVVLVPLCLIMARHEELARISLPGNRSVLITAEAAFHYEPPGYIYCEISDDDRVVVPERRFMGIGPERKPSGMFVASLTGDQRLMAITLNGDVEFLYDFETGQSWPGLYTTIDKVNYSFAVHALDAFHADGKPLTCSRLRDYENRLKQVGKATTTMSK